MRQLYINSTLDGGHWSVSSPSFFYTGKGAPVHNKQEVGGPHNRSGCTDEELNTMTVPGIERRFLALPACSLATVPTTFY